MGFFSFIARLCSPSNAFDEPRQPPVTYYPPQSHYFPEPQYSPEPQYECEPHFSSQFQAVSEAQLVSGLTPIPATPPFVHRFQTLPRHYTDLAEELEWKNDTVRMKGPDANRQPLMMDSSMGMNPRNRTHLRDLWYGDEPWYGEEYDKWESKYVM
jgi:hypothetical protein